MADEFFEDAEGFVGLVASGEGAGHAEHGGVLELGGDAAAAVGEGVEFCEGVFGFTGGEGESGAEVAERGGEGWRRRGERASAGRLAASWNSADQRRARAAVSGAGFVRNVASEATAVSGSPAAAVMEAREKAASVAHGKPSAGRVARVVRASFQRPRPARAMPCQKAASGSLLRSG